MKLPMQAPKCYTASLFSASSRNRSSRPIGVLQPIGAKPLDKLDPLTFDLQRLRHERPVLRPYEKPSWPRHDNSLPSFVRKKEFAHISVGFVRNKKASAYVPEESYSEAEKTRQGLCGGWMYGECKFGMWCNYAHGYEYIHTLKVAPHNARGLLHRRERLMLTNATLRNKLKNTNYELDESEVEDKPRIGRRR
jgi:hypothetical protein